MIQNKFKAGFTLFEMLVAITIMSLVAAVVVYNYSKFNSDIEITNLAYRMALAVREAQVYSISVKQYVGATDPFKVPYGLHFSEKTPDSFILYADADDNGLYTSSGDDTECDVGPGSECVEKVVIGRNNRIKGFCGILWPANSASCFDEAGANMFHSLDIKFKRPNPDALFKAYANSYDPSDVVPLACENSSGNDVACNGWAICLISPHGREKRVVVYETGQISVENVEEGTTCADPT